MKGMKWIPGLFAGCLGALAQPAVVPTVVPTFAYTMNSGVFPAAQLVKVTLPSTISTLPVVVSNVLAAPVNCPPGVNPCGWLTVSPDQGHAPLTLTVSVNPTGLTPGNYAGSFVVDTLPASGAVTVSVNMQISNLPPSLGVNAAPGSLNWVPGAPAGSVGTLNFQYTTGADQSTVTVSELDISSTGDIIPFNVTAANAKTGSSGSASTGVWLRVSSTSPVQGYGIATSGSAGVGSLVPIYVSLDFPTLQSLGIGQYLATITITPAMSNPKLNVSKIVTVALVVSAGAPTVTSVFPASIIPAQQTDPVFTIYGTNFTANTSVFLDVFNGLDIQITRQITTDRLTLVSPKILQAKIPTAYLPVLPAGYGYPYNCTFRITNGGFQEVNIGFTVTNPSSPSISLIVNAASYLPLSKFVGNGTNPVASNLSTAVSPRGIISIFGQNLGPSVPLPATPNAAVSGSCPTGNCYGTHLGTPSMQVAFTYWDPTLVTPGNVTVYAPILMVSINQINAIVPWQVANVLQQATQPQTATVKVWSGATGSNNYTVAVVLQDPGIFTFGGLGQGQGAIINYDANGASTINSSTNKEPRGNVIAIFATGLGDLAPALDGSTIPDGALTQVAAGTPILELVTNVRVYIGGQPAVVQYAGTSPGAVAGLIQINAIVPPTSSTGTVPITLSVGDAATARQAQTGVTLGVK